MMRTALLALTGVGAALAATFWLAPGGERQAEASSGSLELGQRVALLESSLREEADQRVLLELELLALRDELAELRDAAEHRDAAAQPDARPGRGGGQTDTEDRATPRERAAGSVARMFDGAAQSGRRIERLVAAGFSPDRAEWIERRTEELRMEALQAQYDAVRSGAAIDVRSALNGERQLRQELGESDYERYLRALSLPTTVPVRQVLASSPAERAGLQPGDQIVAYGGQRVFSMAELNALILEGQPGQPVAIDVLRDGQPFQLYLPRGPVGVVSGRSFVRRP